MEIDMKFNCRYRVGIEEIGHDHKASLKAMVTFLEDSACWHSATVGYGIKEVETKHRAVALVLDCFGKLKEYLMRERKRVYHFQTFS